LPQVITFTLRDGHLEGGCFGAKGGTFTAEDDRITFDGVEHSPNVTVTFAVDDHGDYTSRPSLPWIPGGAFSCFYKPWTKIDWTAGHSERSPPSGISAARRVPPGRAVT
jgi:hypothetical protein